MIVQTVIFVVGAMAGVVGAMAGVVGTMAGVVGTMAGVVGAKNFSPLRCHVHPHCYVYPHSLSNTSMDFFISIIPWI